MSAHTRAATAHAGALAEIGTLHARIRELEQERRPSAKAAESVEVILGLRQALWDVITVSGHAEGEPDPRGFRTDALIRLARESVTELRTNYDTALSALSELAAGEEAP